MFPNEVEPFFMVHNALPKSLILRVIGNPKETRWRMQKGTLSPVYRVGERQRDVAEKISWSRDLAP